MKWKFGLPESWNLDNIKCDKQKAISYAIAFSFDLVTKDNTALQSLAEKIRAPYKVMLAAAVIAQYLIRGEAPWIITGS